MFIQIYSYLILKLKSNSESMIINIKNNKYGYESKVLQKSKCFFFMLH
jgi:hypothetical protein